MNECNCEIVNCKHNVYVQPPRAKAQKKRDNYVRSGVPMQYESEQKSSYKSHSIESSTTTCSSVKTNCLGGSLKFGLQHPFETIQHSSYQNRRQSNGLDVTQKPGNKPRDCADLLGRGSLNLNTTNRTEYQRKIISQQSKHHGPSNSVFKLDMPVEAQSTYYTSYESPRVEKDHFGTFKSKSIYKSPIKKMEMTTTNNISYKYWTGTSNNINPINNNDCFINKNNPTKQQTTYNFSYSEPGTYSLGPKAVSNEEDLCIKECCKNR